MQEDVIEIRQLFALNRVRCSYGASSPYAVLYLVRFSSESFSSISVSFNSNGTKLSPF